eukprot:Skav206914  [mRNA]  locus=scaffold808:434267:438906:+ [translate_table: standard]
MTLGKLVLEIESKGMTRCGVKFMGASATLVVDAAWMKHLQVGDVITVTNPRATWIEDEMHFHVHWEQDAHILIHHSLKRGKVAIAELFAGLSGWNTACRIIGEQVDIFVEIDKVVAQTLSYQHSCPLVTPTQFIEYFLAHGTFERCVIHGDCNDVLVWVALGTANVGTILASPPCQPWCSVGKTKGLNAPEGQLLPATGKWAGRLGVSLLMLENVAGFPKHDDYRAAIRDIETQGLQMRLHGTFQIDKVLPVKRERWLATFVQKSVQIPHERLMLAQGINFECQSFGPVAVSPSLSDSDAIHVNMTEYERQLLEIPDEVVTMLSDASLAPFWMKDQGRGMSPREVFENRVVSQTQQINGIMASYGKQHKIPIELLQTKGLHTVLAKDNQGIRYWSPWEFLSALGYTQEIAIAIDNESSWQMSGNGLSVAHGWLQLHKTHVYLGDQSPFSPSGTTNEQVKKFQDQAIKLSNFKVVSDGIFQVLKVAECQHVQKKFRSECPPTVPFSIEEDDDTGVSTKAWECQPAFETVQDPRCIAVVGSKYEGGIMILVHDQKHWAMFVNVPASAQISTLIGKGLPHATQEHFESFHFQGSEVSWDQQIQCQSMQKIFFRPKTFEVSCVEKSLHIALKLVIDITWTAKSASAYAAVQLGCNPDVISLAAKSSVLCDDDFLMAYETEEYTMKFKACMPRYVQWSPVMTQIEDPGIIPTVTNQKRWYVRHPAKKLTRTVVAGVQTTVHQLVQALFPDLRALSCWTVHDQVSSVPLDAFANAWENLTIQWEGFRPFRVSEMHSIKGQMSVDCPAMQVHNALEGKSLCIRTPFSAKTKQILLDKNMRLGEIGASFLLHSQVATNMLCMKGAIVLDTETTVEGCMDDGVYSFRLCPMMGGAKFEPIRQRLRETLVARGVPESKVQDRLNGFASKIQLDKLSHIKSDDHEGFWNTVKSMATDAKFRLITSDELKAHQAAMRKERGKGDSKGQKGGGDEASFCFANPWLFP